jgi:hypothetical protein
MIFRALDANGDWTFGKGKQSFLRNEAAVDLNIKTRLLFVLGECYWQTNFGIDWWNLIGGKRPDAETGILVQARQSIIGAYGVVRINSVTSGFDPTSRGLSVAYNIDSIFTRQLSGSATQQT